MIVNRLKCIASSLSLEIYKRFETICVKGMQLSVRFDECAYTMIQKGRRKVWRNRNGQ